MYFVAHMADHLCHDINCIHFVSWHNWHKTLLGPFVPSILPDYQHRPLPVTCSAPSPIYPPRKQKRIKCYILGSWLIVKDVLSSISHNAVANSTAGANMDMALEAQRMAANLVLASRRDKVMCKILKLSTTYK